MLLLEENRLTPAAAAVAAKGRVLVNVSSEALTADYSILTIKLVDTLKKDSLRSYC